MATHDYSIANQSFPATRSDINNALAAIQSSNSAATAPSGTGSTVAGELFYDTSNNQLKVATDANGTFVAASLDSSGDLTVSNDLTVTNDTTVSNDLTVSGDISCAGTISSTSDEKLKTGIKIVTDAVDKVYQLNGVEFTWRKDGRRSAGVIAQNVQNVMPEAVSKQPKLEDSLAVNYNALHALYIEAIKELKDLVDAQAQEIELLKKG